MTRPYYIDDPLMDRSGHQLTMHSAAPGEVFGECSCGEWTTPTWDTHAVLEAFDQHMTAVQAGLPVFRDPMFTEGALCELKTRWATCGSWNCAARRGSVSR